jgi:curved DNA-binding protein CbpA
MNYHYETLRINRDATPGQIKAAYKKWAQTLHPDKGGGIDSFQKLQEAYRVLSNPELRARYDRGESTGPVETTEQKARTRLATMFAQAAAAARDDKDMIEMIRTAIQSGTEKAKQDVIIANSKIKKLEHTLSRVTYKGAGINLLEGVINQQIRAHNEQISQLQAEIDLVDTVTGMLDDYECEVDTPRFNNSFASSTTTSWIPG